MQRVCHFSSVHHVWDTRVFYRECVSLAKEYQVTLIAIGDEGNYSKLGVNVIAVNKPQNFIERYLFTIFKVFFLAIKQEASLYHIHDAEMVPFGIILRILGKKVIYDIHENTHDDILLKTWIPLKIRSFIASLYNILLWFGSKFLHYIVVVAEPKFLPKFFVNESKATIIQNFADIDDYSNFLVEKRSAIKVNNLFYVGMIKDMYYDIYPVLDSLRILKSRGVNCHLHIIGYFGKNKEANLETYTFWEEVKSMVTFYGFLETAKAYQISTKCKIGLCIKNQPEEMLVSHERKFFEYMCIGLPSIFCNQSIYKDLNEKHNIGISINILNPSEIAEAIEFLLSNPIVLDEKSSNSYQTAMHTFNWKMESKVLLKLYKSLLE
ncbi:MAG: glycosyltransferase [Bacteroidia bacterium]|nr:glycosyltransferase [Bacteroidia bacterium]